jgi:hypothetical protein
MCGILALSSAHRLLLLAGIGSVWENIIYLTLTNALPQRMPHQMGWLQKCRRAVKELNEKMENGRCEGGKGGRPSSPACAQQK